MSADECYEMLKSEIPGLLRKQVPDALGRIHALLTPRQRWQLSVRLRGRNRSRTQLSHDSLDRIPDPAPAPELLARSQEEAEALQRAMSRLTVAQRVLLHLRFHEGLTYERIARMEQLGDAHRARRKVQSALGALRIEFQTLPGTQKRQN